MTATPEFLIWTHLWVSVSQLSDPHLQALLRLVADDVTGGVIVTSPAMRRLYSPYDGGADIIATSSEQRDRLRSRYPEWLSPRPSGPWRAESEATKSVANDPGIRIDPE
jgi:hypothetical protein